MTSSDPQPSLTDALALHRSGKLSEAERLYREIIRDFPRCADAFHLMGMLAHQTGRSAEGRDLLLRAIGINPADAAYHSNLGTVLCSVRDFDAAAKAFAAALALKPDLVETRCNLALVLLVQGKFEQAIESCRRALQIRSNCVEAHLAWADARQALHRNAEAEAHYREAVAIAPGLPDRYRQMVAALAGENKVDQALAACQTLIRLAPTNADAHRLLGILFQRNRQPALALAALRRALEMNPASPDVHLNLAVVLQENADTAAAAEHYRKALELRPNWHEARLGLATLTGENTPPALPAESIQRLFDQYAPTFDEHVTHTLHYHGGRELLAAFQKLRPDARDLAILDLGCGTGLCGDAFKPLAFRLVGVDLSPGMIERAQARGIYDQLLQADIANLPAEWNGQFDLLLAGDVFLYVGDLGPALAAAFHALHPDGHFALTIEATAGDGYRLQLNSRYAHSVAYVESAAAAAGLIFVHQSPITLRREKNAAIPGHVIVLRRPSAELMP